MGLATTERDKRRDVAATGELPREVWALGFSLWKRRFVREFLHECKVHFVRKVSAVPPGSTLVVWGRREVSQQIGALQVLRLEDGFLRSVGLGADLIRPVSWVVDTVGIYYDATRPSLLEQLLQTYTFSTELLVRAANLRERIVNAGVTKYNVGEGDWQRPPGVQRVILVPGQVETDAALEFGAPRERRNIELLKRVRAQNPGAYVVYKPHPDVVAGLRARGQQEMEAARWCDAVVTNTSINCLLLRVDEVHALTSLAGFEGLLRGRRVVTYGQPFYAGWGLTEDQVPVQRRTRRLSIDELVAGSLLLYPRYIGRNTGKPVSAEQALDELLEWRTKAGNRLPMWRKMLRLVLRMTIGGR